MRKKRPLARLCEEAVGRRRKPEDAEARWIGEEVSRDHAAKRGAEKTWPAVTDWEKLDSAFRALERVGIMAVHDVGCGDIRYVANHLANAYIERGGKASAVVGCCFYYRSDIHRAIRGQGLLLGFGDMTGDEAKSVEIGRQVVAELERAGFHLTWNGEKARRITIENLRWQKRGP